MKILIAGSRSITDFDLTPLIPSDATVIVCGGANGVDRLAEEYADRHRISKIVLQPQYEKYGRAAPLKRNEDMVNTCDMILVLWDGVSKGSQYTIEYAKKLGKPLRVIMV